MPFRLIPLLVALLLHTSPTWRGAVCPAWMVQAFACIEGLGATPCAPCCSESCTPEASAPCGSPTDERCPCFAECSTPLPAVKPARTTVEETDRAPIAWSGPFESAILRITAAERPDRQSESYRSHAPPRSRLCVWVI